MRRGLRHGVGNLRGEWIERHPCNIPGPIYVGVDDECGCGPIAAPMNVMMLDQPSGEFVFRQPNSEEELDHVLRAAEMNPLRSYAIDGNSHWTRETVTEWWRRAKAEQRSLRKPRPSPEYAR